MGAALLVNLKDIAIHLLERLARNSHLFIEHFGTVPVDTQVP